MGFLSEFRRTEIMLELIPLHTPRLNLRVLLQEPLDQAATVVAFSEANCEMMEPFPGETTQQEE
jgi:hypothetical protein